MIPVEKYYREAVYAALNGIQYNGSPVPVFSGYAETEENLYIVLEGITSNPDLRNKQKHITAATLVIEVVHTQERAISYKVVDEVGELLLAELIGTPNQALFTLDTDFKALNPEVVSTNYIIEETLNKIVRKIIRLRTVIEQL